jgi:hypothetical protein
MGRLLPCSQMRPGSTYYTTLGYIGESMQMLESWFVCALTPWACSHALKCTTAPVVPDNTSADADIEASVRAELS